VFVLLLEGIGGELVIGSMRDKIVSIKLASDRPANVFHAVCSVPLDRHEPMTDGTIWQEEANTFRVPLD
jgi:hypothetical protein